MLGFDEVLESTTDNEPSLWVGFDDRLCRMHPGLGTRTGKYVVAFQAGSLGDRINPGHRGELVFLLGALGSLGMRRCARMRMLLVSEGGARGARAVVGFDDRR